MAWRHPDVCNRHQKSFRPGRGREALRGFLFLWSRCPLGSRCEACCAKLECDMQRSSCFGGTDHTIPIILLRAMLHLFFFSGMLVLRFLWPSNVQGYY
ncbi:hypothetical protein V8C44DRAFT_339366 [Trichoderma aethiopicum]